MYRIGIDIGASKILGVLTEVTRDHAVVVSSAKVLTPQTRGELLHELFQIIAALFGARGKHAISHVGIAVAGAVDAHGVITRSPNLSFLDGFPVRAYFSRRVGKPVNVINDAQAFLTYSMQYGVARGYHNVAGVVLGSGVGGAIAFDGGLVAGAHGSAGEVGHMIIDLDAHKGGWNVKSLESLASAKTLTEVGTGYAELGENLGIGLANIVNILDPEMVVIGGGLASAGDLMLVRARNVMAEHVMAPRAKTTPVRIERDYEVASAVGATLFH